MNKGSYLYPLFEHMQREHGLTLTESELREICRISENALVDVCVEKQENEEQMKKVWKPLRQLVLKPCCADYCRDWRETLGGTLPASDHAPTCGRYVRIPFTAVRRAEDEGKGAFCVFDNPMDVESFCEEDPDTKYVIKRLWITRDQYEKLDEFQGF